MNRISSDIIFGRTGCNIYGGESCWEHLQETTHRAEQQQRDIDNAIKDCLGATENETQRYERLERPTAEEGRNYTRHIPLVIRDIVKEMPPGRINVEEILRRCVDDQPTQSQSDEEDSEINSGYLRGQISSSSE